MKHNLFVQDFVNTFNQLHALSELSLASVIPFDFPAFATAKQIWIQNMRTTSQESIELRNKAQQLMRVLQYPQNPTQEDHYQYPPKLIAATTRPPRQDQNNENKQKQFVKCKQPEVSVKMATRAKPSSRERSTNSIHEQSGNFNLDPWDNYCRRDENVDSSNLNHIMPYLKGVADLTQTSSRPSLPLTKIVQLNKKQYKKNVPKLDQDQAAKPFIKQTNNDINEKCQGNCFHIRYECCCSQKECRQFGDQEKVKINQFLLKSPNTRNRSYTQEPNYRVQNKKGLRGCSRVQTYNQMGRQTGSQMGKGGKDEHRTEKWEGQEEQEQSILQKFEINKKKSPNKIYMQEQSSDEQDGNRRKSQREERISRMRELHNLKQMQENSELQMLRQMKKIKQMQMQEIQMAKIQELRQVEKMREIKRNHLDQLLKMQRERQWYLQAQTKNSTTQEVEQIEKVLMTQRGHEKANDNEADRLKKLKNQFSEIHCQEPDDDQRRVFQQIKQLQGKLNEIASSNLRPLRTQESHSPSAKVVRLNLTPSRTNLHKNMAMNPRSPASRVVVPSKTCRLLSKRIENGTKAR